MLHVQTTSEKRRKVCGACKKTFQAGDKYVEEATSAYGGNMHISWIHFECFLLANWRYFPEKFSDDELRSFAKKHLFGKAKEEEDDE